MLRATLCWMVRIVLAASVLNMLLVAPARAQTSDAPNPSFAAGYQRYANGDFQGAAAAFRQAYQETKNPQALFNLGRAAIKAGQAVDALDALEQFLGESRDPSEASRRATAGREIESLSKQVGTLTLRVSPSGAEVQVDDKSYGPGRQTRPIHVAAGSHQLSATLAGHQRWSRGVQLARGQTLAIDIRLDPLVRPSQTLRTLSYLIGGAGVIATVVGAYFGVRAKAKLDDSNRDCSAQSFCHAPGKADRNAAISAANISTAAFIVGGVGIAGGVTLFVVGAPPVEREQRTGAGDALRVGATLQGSF